MSFSAVADTVNIGVLSRAVRTFVEDLAFPEDVCYNTDLVVSEALTNVMVHGFRESRPEPVLLTVLAFLSGLVLVAMSVLRLGFLANFLSHPVIAGFITASAVLIAMGQIGSLIGVKMTGASLPGR